MKINLKGIRRNRSDSKYLDFNLSKIKSAVYFSSDLDDLTWKKLKSLDEDEWDDIILPEIVVWTTDNEKLRFDPLTLIDNSGSHGLVCSYVCDKTKELLALRIGDGDFPTLPVKPNIEENLDLQPAEHLQLLPLKRRKKHHFLTIMNKKDGDLFNLIDNAYEEENIILQQSLRQQAGNIVLCLAKLLQFYLKQGYLYTDLKTENILYRCVNFKNDNGSNHDSLHRDEYEDLDEKESDDETLTCEFKLCLCDVESFYALELLGQQSCMYTNFYIDKDFDKYNPTESDMIYGLLCVYYRLLFGVEVNINLSRRSLRLKKKIHVESSKAIEFIISYEYKRKLSTLEKFIIDLLSSEKK